MQPANIKEVLPIDILKDGLGRTLYSAIDLSKGTLLATNSSKNANINIESGEIAFSQEIGDSKMQGATIIVWGSYQRIKTSSGEDSILLDPLHISVDYNNFPGKTACGTDYHITGHVQCLVKGSYLVGSKTLIANQQCLSHTGGFPDNLRFKVDGDTHRLRFQLSGSSKGKWLDFSKKAWSGVAYLDGISIPLTQSASFTESCE